MYEEAVSKGAAFFVTTIHMFKNIFSVMINQAILTKSKRENLYCDICK